MKELIIIGAGGFGREVKCLIDLINKRKATAEFSIVGFVDDGIAAGTMIHGLPVLGPIDFINSTQKVVNLVLAIANPKIKKQIYQRFNQHNFPTIIHPSVSLENYNVVIGQGCIICEGSVLSCDIEIGDFCVINWTCTIGHDVKINSFSSFMPAVNISGEVTVGEGVYVGAGATIINQLSIGEGSIIGAGAVVSKSIPAHCTAVGIPAKPIKFSNENE
ncbi:MAG: acetyltransferase [Altibacter sp.]|uniref:acetyltransferase n=1 Tax=Altibacter sp. TaxID=2024823 RepID=UPI001E050E06|nr:acetyltransferase [Altibacter sp.]MBZ0327468.1 acetyltransferase [Altibacter sp.]